MAKLDYSLVIEATRDPNFFGFYSPDLKGFTGTGRSIADCIINAAIAMDEFVNFLRQEGLPIPKKSANATILIENGQRIVQSMMRKINKRPEVHVIHSGATGMPRISTSGRASYPATSINYTSHEGGRTASHSKTSQYVIRNQDKTKAKKATLPHNRKRKSK